MLVGEREVLVWGSLIYRCVSGYEPSGHQLMFASATRHFKVVRGTVPTLINFAVLEDSGHICKIK